MLCYATEEAENLGVNMNKFFYTPIAALTLGLAFVQPATAATIEVVPWLAPNVFGSPSFSTAEQNAIQAMYQDLTAYGTPGTPGYFQAQSNVTSAQAIVTGFASWRGQVNPGVVFGPAFAAELGNRMTFALRINGDGSQFSISQLSFVGTSTDAPYNALNFSFAAGLFNYGTGYAGVLKGTDGLLWTNDDIFITGGANTQLVDALVGRGSGNSFAAYCAGCSLADQQAALNASAAYPGFDFTFTGQYSLGDSTGSGTFNVTSAVPEPATWAMMLLGFAGLGFLAHRKSRKNFASA